jgi:hypothetical protein
VQEASRYAPCILILRHFEVLASEPGEYEVGSQLAAVYALGIPLAYTRFPGTSFAGWESMQYLVDCHVNGTK